MSAALDLRPAANSTTVRSTKTGLPSWARTGFGVLHRVAPSLAAEAAARMFFATRRGAPRRGERDVLASASPFFVEAAGERVAAWSWGAGPTVVLVHGWNGRATQLGALVAPLVESGRRVVAFDHPGHGESTGRSATVVQMGEAVRAVARAAGGAHGLVAHSLGAVASTLALCAGLPVERAVFIAPPIAAEPWLHHLAREVGLDERGIEATRERIERRAGRTLASLRLTDLAPSLRTPLLIVHDRDDREVPIESGEALSYAWPRSRLLVTAGLGHHKILGSPGVIESARRFLTRAGA